MKILHFTLLFLLFFFFSFQNNAPADKENLKVALYLNQIAGISPMVFTDGWVFGAKGILDKGTENESEFSENIKWSGSGTFTPDVGPVTRPVFNKEGYNYITLNYDYQGKTYSETFDVYAVSSDDYACAKDYAICYSDVHGCPTCPHQCIGFFDTWSTTVFIRGSFAIRKGDIGKHVVCCGANTLEVVDGDPNVLADGKPVAKLGSETKVGSKTKHCGGMGSIFEENSKESKDMLKYVGIDVK